MALRSRGLGFRVYYYKQTIIMADAWEIVPLQNPDKELHEKTAANDDPLSLLHPSRVLLRCVRHRRKYM